jgi:tetratricopeptide (TPR) repeat protein
MLLPSVKQQRELIQRIEDEHRPLTHVEVIENAAALSGNERRAVQLVRQGRFGDALPHLILWRDKTPNSVAAWLMLGVAHAGMGNVIEAEDCFTTGTRLSPQFGFSYFQRGLARHERGQYSAAAADFSRYLDLRGASPAALINRALAYHAMDANESALRDLNAALTVGARQTRIYFILAKVRLALNDKAGAEADFRRGLEQIPTDVISWLARGMAQLEGSPEQALADFKQALRLDPHNRTAAQNILHVLSDRLHREQEAMVFLEQMIAANPRDSRALLTRAVLRARQGNVADAVADAETALTIDSNPVAALQAACAFAQSSRHAPHYRDQAFKLLAQSLAAKPTLSAIALTDADLAPLRKSEQFNRIVSAADVIRTGGTATEEATAAR